MREYRSNQQEKEDAFCEAVYAAFIAMIILWVLF